MSHSSIFNEWNVETVLVVSIFYFADTWDIQKFVGKFYIFRLFSILVASLVAWFYEFRFMPSSTLVPVSRLQTKS